MGRALPAAAVVKKGKKTKCAIRYLAQGRKDTRLVVGSIKMNTTLEYSTRVVQEGDHRCKKSTLNDLAYLTLLRIPLMNPVQVRYTVLGKRIHVSKGLGTRPSVLYGTWQKDTCE